MATIQYTYFVPIGEIFGKLLPCLVRDFVNQDRLIVLKPYKCVDIVMNQRIVFGIGTPYRQEQLIIITFFLFFFIILLFGGAN